MNQFFEDQANLIKHLKATDIYQIGVLLNETKQELDHGDWLSFLSDHRVRLSPRTAQAYMQVTRENDGYRLAEFGIAKAMLLLERKPNAVEREKFLAEHDPLKLTVKQLRELLGLTTTKKAQKSTAESGQFDQQIIWAAGVLHIEPSKLSRENIPTAFRRMAQIFHTDKQLTQDETFMRTLIQAREILWKHFGIAEAAAA